MWQKAFNNLILLNIFTCQAQQSLEDYNRNYGLYSNVYNFPNFSITTNSYGYRVDEASIQESATGMQIPLTLNSNSSFFGNSVYNLIVDIAYETTERIHVKIYDKDKNQVEVPDSPLGLVRPNTRINTSQRRPNSSSKNYNFVYQHDPFSFQIIRNSDNAVLFDTSGLPLVFEDQYLEISTSLPANGTNIYGIGETLAPFKRKNNVTTLFARDAHDKYQNMYGAHPFYVDIRQDGSSHGTFLLNAHGMDIITTDTRITYKAIGGILDFYFFVPQDKLPNSVVQAYANLVGKPMMPSHWMLGYQTCRYGYPNIEHVQSVVQRHKDNLIPLEVQWIDIDYMDERKDFTFDPIHFPQDKMIELSNTLHSNNQRFILIVDPAIPVASNYQPYLKGKELDIFVKNRDGSGYVGQVWPGYTVFPDWWHPNISTYWDEEIGNWMRLLKLDGLWIDMNEPSAFCLGSCGSLHDPEYPSREPWFNNVSEQLRLHTLQENALNAMGQPLDEKRNLLYPKYVINNGAGNLSEKTLAMTAQHYKNVSHYDLHNIYGHAEGYITREALLKYNDTTRPFLLSRSTFAGSGQYMGHWTGDIFSNWEDLRLSVADVLNFQMFGISYSGADICGFVGNTTEELCTRWMELGAFYPFARNHNSETTIDQEPYLWKTTAEASRIALGIRYSLLPYFYTLFDESHKQGTGVWRPLVFEYPQHVADFSDNDRQFLVGTDILVSPVLLENSVTVDAQFPPGLWYDWYDYSLINSTSSSELVKLTAPLMHIPVHIRGGSILPTKSPKLLVKDTYETPYNLIIALDEKSQATGRLYIDDGHSLQVDAASNVNLIFTNSSLIANGQFNYPGAEMIGNITILNAYGFKYSKAVDNGGTVFDALTLENNHTTFTFNDARITFSQSFTLKFI